MDDVRLEYSQLRGSWNVFVNGEWYYEGTYEDATKVADSFFWDDEDEYVEEEYDYENN